MSRYSSILILLYPYVTFPSIENTPVWYIIEISDLRCMPSCTIFFGLFWSWKCRINIVARNYGLISNHNWPFKHLKRHIINSSMEWCNGPKFHWVVFARLSCNCQNCYCYALCTWYKLFEKLVLQFKLYPKVTTSIISSEENLVPSLMVVLVLCLRKWMTNHSSEILWINSFALIKIGVYIEWTLQFNRLFVNIYLPYHYYPSIWATTNSISWIGVVTFGCTITNVSQCVISYQFGLGFLPFYRWNGVVTAIAVFQCTFMPITVHWRKIVTWHALIYL